MALSIFTGLSLVAMSEETWTSDESVHLPAGCTYLARRDFRLNPEHPPLVKMLAAVPVLLAGLKWPEDSSYWDHASLWPFGFQVIFRSGNDPDRMLFLGRLPTLLWGWILIVAVYGASRKRFGPRAGLLSLAIITFCPTLLAHGHLVTTDAAAAALFFVTCLSFWSLLERGTWIRCGLCGVMVGLTLSAKYSGILLAPVMVLLAGIRFLTEPLSPPADKPGSPPPIVTVRQAVRWSGMAFVLAGTAYAVLWALYGFRFQASPDPTFSYDWKLLSTVGGLSERAVLFARDHRLLPESFLYGYTDVIAHSLRGHKAYALGMQSPTGWWWYFPFAFLVKTPVGVLVLFGWGLVELIRRPENSSKPWAYLVVPLAVYWSSAITSNINIGVRHVLPVFPFFAVLSGAIVSGDGSRVAAGCRVAFLLAALGIASCLAQAPYFLSYFNYASLCFAQRHQMLVDSNLDWGQDLARLKRYMDAHGIPEIKLAYSGVGSPRHLGLRHTILSGSNMYSQYETEWEKAGSIRAGEYVAVSANVLVGLLGTQPELYASLFQPQEPVARIGHSILLYRMPGSPPRPP